MNNPAPVPLWRDPAALLNTKLPEMLHLLMDAGGSNVIAPPSIMPDPSPRDAFEKLVVATRLFEIAPGVRLSDHFWQHAGDFRRGAVADQLRETAEGRGKFVPGFLAIYATSVRSPLAYGPKRMPFRVAETIDMAEGISGPYLVLVACRLLGNGKAEAVRGYAQPILDGRRFVPVASELERDVLRALEKLQVTLDAQGVDCAIERVLPTRSEPQPSAIRVAISREDRLIRELRVVVDGETFLRSEHDEVSFVVTSVNWSNGAFVSWLEHAILG